jgi:hypothetical protein
MDTQDTERGQIKQKLTTKGIYIFGNSSHYEWRAALSDTILKRDHAPTIPAKVTLIWFSGFRGEDLNVIFYKNMPNLHNQYKSVERKISQKNLEYMLNCVRQRRPPFIMAAVTKNINSFSCQFLLYYKSK